MMKTHTALLLGGALMAATTLTLSGQAQYPAQQGQRPATPPQPQQTQPEQRQQQIPGTPQQPQQDSETAQQLQKLNQELQRIQARLTALEQQAAKSPEVKKKTKAYEDAIYSKMKESAPEMKSEVEELKKGPPNCGPARSCPSQPSSEARHSTRDSASTAH